MQKFPMKCSTHAARFLLYTKCLAAFFLLFTVAEKTTAQLAFPAFEERQATTSGHVDSDSPALNGDPFAVNFILGLKNGVPPSQGEWLAPFQTGASPEVETENLYAAIDRINRYISEGNQSQALAAIDAAMATFGELPMLLYRGGHVAADAGEFRLAATYWQKLSQQELSPARKVEVMSTWGAVLFLADDIEAAAQRLQRAQQLGSIRLRDTFALFAIRAAQQDYTAAQRIIQRKELMELGLVAGRMYAGYEDLVRLVGDEAYVWMGNAILAGGEPGIMDEQAELKARSAETALWGSDAVPPAPDASLLAAAEMRHWMRDLQQFVEEYGRFALAENYDGLFALIEEWESGDRPFRAPTFQAFNHYAAWHAGEGKAALNRLQALKSRYPNALSVQTRWVTLLLERHQFTEAAQVAESVLQAHAPDPMMQLLWASALAGKGNTDVALAVFDQFPPATRPLIAAQLSAAPAIHSVLLAIPELPGWVEIAD